MVGWRQGRPVVILNEGADDNTTVLSQVNPDGTLTTLSTFQTHILQIPAGLIDSASFGGPAMHPPAFDPANWVYYSLAAFLTVIVIVIVVVRRLWRSWVTGAR